MLIDNIKKLCEEKGTSLYALEEELGFGNGSIAKSPNLRSDRLQKIADYFGVTTDYLLSGGTKEGYYANEEVADMMQKIFDSPGRRTLFETTMNMDEKTIQKYADFIKGITDDNNKNN